MPRGLYRMHVRQTNVRQPGYSQLSSVVLESTPFFGASVRRLQNPSSCELKAMMVFRSLGAEGCTEVISLPHVTTQNDAACPLDRFKHRTV